MDPENQILVTATQVVGCNGLRNFADLGKMRQQTLEKRLTAAQKKLTRANMMSVYAMWLRDQITRIGGTERTTVVKDCCKFFDSWNCDLERVLEVWGDCTECTVRGLSWADEDRALRQMDAVRQEIKKVFSRARSTDARARFNPTELTSKDEELPGSSSRALPPRPPETPLRMEEFSTERAVTLLNRSWPPPASQPRPLTTRAVPGVRPPSTFQAALKPKVENTPQPTPKAHPLDPQNKHPRQKVSLQQARKNYSGVVPSGIDLTTELWSRPAGNPQTPLKPKGGKATRSSSKDLSLHPQTPVPTTKVSLPQTTQKRHSDAIPLGINPSTEFENKRSTPKTNVELGDTQGQRREESSVSRGYLCKRCGVEGHYIQDCPTRNAPPSDYVCKRCRVKGHYVQYCSSKLDQPLNNPPGLDYDCKRCGGKGHDIQYCPNNIWDPKPGSNYICGLCGVASDHYLFSCPKAYKYDKAEQAGIELQYDHVIKREPASQHKEDCQDGRLSPWESSTHLSRASEELESGDQQDESEAYHTAKDFLDKLEDLPGMLDEPESTQGYSRRPSHKIQSPFSRSPPSKRQKLEFEDQVMDDIQEFEVSKSNDPDYTTKVPEVCESDDSMDDFEGSEIEVEKHWDPISSSETSEPFERAEPIERHVTQKSLFRVPPYDPAVIRLFLAKGNVWVSPPSRSTALDMWDAQEGNDRTNVEEELDW
ncbi:Fc.00g089650.m01.CDS01 [Cosmosporella sp. VM-42]